MRIIKFTAAAVLALGLASGSASAQQEGLVNVSVDGNVVQVPIGVAAQVNGASFHCGGLGFQGRG